MWLFFFKKIYEKGENMLKELGNEIIELFKVGEVKAIIEELKGLIVNA